MGLKKLPNIGPELERLLSEADIRDSEQLRRLGTEQVFLRLRGKEPTACFHKLIAIEGAIQGIKKSQISPERKQQLRQFFDKLSKTDRI